jgi:hypothetical protein
MDLSIAFVEIVYYFNKLAERSFRKEYFYHICNRKFALSFLWCRRRKERTKETPWAISLSADSDLGRRPKNPQGF